MSKRTSRPARSKSGFTLKELVVVILVIGIIGAVSLPRMENDPVLLSTQMEQLAGDIRYVQALAMTQGQRYIISFPTAASYQILNQTGNPVVHPVTGSNAAIALGAGVTLALAGFAPAGNALGFNGLGVPFSVTAPATFNGALTAAASVVLTKGTSSDSIVITHQTGKVTP